MKETKLETLAAQTQLFCASVNSGPVFIFDSETEKLLHELVLGIFEEPQNKEEYLALIERIRKVCDCSPELLSASFGSMGFEEYQKGSPSLAETTFRLALGISPDEGLKNNLAYVCRRHRDTLGSSNIEILDLLLTGVRMGDTFALINMALHFAFSLSRQDDWRLADKMFSLVSTNNSSFSSAQEWWGDLADVQDDEGILVLHWLDRHGKIEFPEHLKEFRDNLRHKHRDIPEWVFEKAQ